MRDQVFTAGTCSESKRFTFCDSEFECCLSRTLLTVNNATMNKILSSCILMSRRRT
jgi:hypothetical protein